MLNKYLLAVLIAFVVVAIVDWPLQTFLFMGLYEQSSELWRPMQEMKFVLGYIVFILNLAGFAYIYWKMVSNKSAMRGLIYGVVWGLAAGLGMGYGTYAYMPIPYWLAFGWFISSVIEYGIAGWIIGKIIKE